MCQCWLARISRTSSRPNAPAPYTSTRRLRLLRVAAISPIARNEPRVIISASVSRIGSSTSTPRWKPSKRYSSDATASTSSEPSPTPAHHRREVAQPEGLPRPLIEPRRVERRQPAAEHHRQRRGEERQERVELGAVEAQAVGAVVADRDQHQVEQHLGRRATGTSGPSGTARTTTSAAPGSPRRCRQARAPGRCRPGRGARRRRPRAPSARRRGGCRSPTPRGRPPARRGTGCVRRCAPRTPARPGGATRDRCRPSTPCGRRAAAAPARSRCRRAAR